jgi:hypothetical protein
MPAGLGHGRGILKGFFLLVFLGEHVGPLTLLARGLCLLRQTEIADLPGRLKLLLKINKKLRGKMLAICSDLWFEQQVDFLRMLMKASVPPCRFKDTGKRSEKKIRRKNLKI